MKIEYRLYEIFYDEEWDTTEKTLLATYTDVQEALTDRNEWRKEAKAQGKGSLLEFEVVVESGDE